MFEKVYKVDLDIKIAHGDESFLNMLYRLSARLARGIVLDTNEPSKAFNTIGEYSSLAKYVESRMQQKNQQHKIGGITVTNCRISEGSLDLFFQALIVGIANYEKIKNYIDDVVSILQSDMNQIFGLEATVISHCAIKEENVGSELKKQDQLEEINRRSQVVPAANYQESQMLNKPNGNVSDFTQGSKGESKPKFTLLHFGILFIIVLQAYSALTNNNQSNNRSVEEKLKTEDTETVVRETVRDEIQKMRINSFLQRHDSLSAFR